MIKTAALKLSNVGRGWPNLVVAERELQAPPLNENVHHAVDEVLAGHVAVRLHLEQIQNLHTGGVANTHKKRPTDVGETMRGGSVHTNVASAADLKDGVPS